LTPFLNAFGTPVELRKYSQTILDSSSNGTIFVCTLLISYMFLAVVEVSARLPGVQSLETVMGSRNVARLSPRGLEYRSSRNVIGSSGQVSNLSCLYAASDFPDIDALNASSFSIYYTGVQTI
jgi:hypothetical protein